jgi:hypothetical protein
MANQSEGKNKKKDAATTIPPKLQRRIIIYLNKARHEDLLMQPNEGIQIMHEHQPLKGPEVHGHAKKLMRKDFLDSKIAKDIIDLREQNSPLFGFSNIKQVLDALAPVPADGIITAFGPASYGQWDDPFDIPSEYDRPVHSALLSSGKVLLFGLPSGNNTFLWNPAMSGPAAFNSPGNQPTDSLFCSGHSILSNGKVLVVGGGGDGTVTPHHNHGWKFNPETEGWERTLGDGSPGGGDMHYVRWYPTLVTLGDRPGKVLVVSGRNGTDVAQMEVYFESSDSFEPVWGPAGVGDTSANRSFPQLFPGLNILPGGEIFYTPTGWLSGGSLPLDFPTARPSSYFKFSSTSPPVTGKWYDVGAIDPVAEDTIDRVKGMAVLLLHPSYPFVQIMVAGGGQDPQSTTTNQIINLSEFGPEWGTPLPFPDGLSRLNVNLVLLPDSRVFVCGGRPLEGTPQDGGTCWIFDPPSYTWYEMDHLANTRQYHSVALLLPNGRVMVAGNEATNDRTIEIFSPPYLFNPDGTTAARPTINSAPDLVEYGSSFSIETPDAPNIQKVVFVRPMAVTHQTDSEQRVIQLSFTHTGPSTLTATAPDGWHPHAFAPGGYYMLFIVNNNGVPSNAWMTTGKKLIYLK